MFRLVIIPLLTCSLLACPLRCVPASAISASDTSVGPMAGCTCCAPSPAVSTAGAAEDLTASLPPVDDCGCLNCICQGAVLESGADAMAMAPLDLGEGLLVGASVGARGSLGSPYLLRPDRCSSHGYMLGGRAARIAHCSLLI